MCKAADCCRFGSIKGLDDQCCTNWKAVKTFIAVKRKQFFSPLPPFSLVESSYWYLHFGWHLGVFLCKIRTLPWCRMPDV